MMNMITSFSKYKKKHQPPNPAPYSSQRSPIAFPPINKTDPVPTSIEFPMLWQRSQIFKT